MLILKTKIHQLILSNTEKIISLKKQCTDYKTNVFQGLSVDTQQTSKERYRELSRALCASLVSLFRRSRAFYFCILDYR